MRRLAGVGAQHPQAADEHGHLRGGERQQLRLVDQQCLGRQAVAALQVVAESVGDGFQRGEGGHVGLLLRGVGAAGRERHGDRLPGGPGGLFHGRAAGQHDQVSQRDLLAAVLRAVEPGADGVEFLQHLGQLRRLVGGPVLLRRQADTGAIGTAALVGAAEGGGRCPGGGHQLRHRQARGQHLLLERRNILRIDQRVVHGGQGVLPDQDLGRHFGAQVAGARAHVAVGELEPGAREGIGELVGVCQEAARDLLVGRVHPQRQVGGQHGGHDLLRRVVCVRDGGRGALGGPLVCAGGALGQFPFEAEQVLEEVVAPLCGRGGPGDFQSAGDGVGALAAAEAVLPAETLAFQAGGFGLVGHVGRGAGAVGLAEAVAAGDQCHRLFVVHGHAGEGVADVAGRSERVGLAVRAFGVDVDQAHLHGGQRVLQVTCVRLLAVVVLHQHAMAFRDAGRALRITHVAAEPFGLAAPVHVQVRFPHVGAATGKTEGLETHGFQGHVAGEDQQVGPGNLLAILLLDGPEQAARLVQAHVVGPAVQRRETLLAAARTAAAIADAVGAGAVPGHTHEQRAVVAEVGRPPVLGVGHQRGEVFFQRCQVQALERLGVVEAGAQGVGLGGMLLQQVQPQLPGPPVAVGGAATGGLVEGTLRFGLFAGHGELLLSVWSMIRGQQIIWRKPPTGVTKPLSPR